MPEDALTGFLGSKGEAQGRPVGVVVDDTGAILVADDVGNAIWRVSPVQGYIFSRYFLVKMKSIACYTMTLVL